MAQATILVSESRSTPTDGVLTENRKPLSYLHWGPIVGGALIAASAFFVLMTFATAIGLGVTSVSPTWRDTSVGLTVLSGAWVVLTAIGSFALGGYVAGRVRSTWLASAEEIHFRDGLHGLVAWALAIIIGAILTSVSAVTLAQSAVKTNFSTPIASPEEPSFLTFELDRLFRSDKRPEAGDADARAEAGRIITSGLGRRDLASDDRDYLVRLVSARTGLSPADADQRVTRIISESRDAAAKARQAAIIIGFTLAAALTAAAAAAWGAARIGGRHRDNDVALPLSFRVKRSTI